MSRVLKSAKTALAPAPQRIGTVPARMEDVLELPGVARKTAGDRSVPRIKRKDHPQQVSCVMCHVLRHNNDQTVW